MKIPIYRDIYDMGTDIYPVDEFNLEPGVSVLVGCNGSGKSTLLFQLKEYAKKNDIRCIFYNTLEDHANKMDEYARKDNWNGVAKLMQSSEGERILDYIGDFAYKVGTGIRMVSSGNSIFVLVDAADSGLSVDNAIEVNEFFNLAIEDAKKKNIEVYIVVATNAFEFARDNNCLDVTTLEYLRFKDYEEYREFVLNTRQKKKERYDNINEKVKHKKDSEDRKSWDTHH